MLDLHMVERISPGAETPIRWLIQLLQCILEQVPPPLGNADLLNNIGNMGHRWIRLDPQGPKTPEASWISGSDQRGRRQQVPGGPEPGRPQELIF